MKEMDPEVAAVFNGIIDRMKVDLRKKAADNGDMAAIAILDAVDMLTDKGEDKDLKSALMVIASMRVNGFGKAAASAVISALSRLCQAIGMGGLRGLF
jgi:hypothetical protein